MSTKISFGRFKNHKIQTIPNNSKGNKTAAIRPTVSTARSSLFNTLLHNSLFSNFDIENASILDLCCGSGIIGLEFLSLGATNVTFLDNNTFALNNIKKHLEKLNLQQNTAIINKSLPSIFYGKTYDLIFFDPPYDSRTLMHSQFDLIDRHNILNEKGVLIMEMDKSFDFTKTHKSFDKVNLDFILEKKINSKTKFMFFQKN